MADPPKVKGYTAIPAAHLLEWYEYIKGYSPERNQQPSKHTPDPVWGPHGSGLHKASRQAWEDLDRETRTWNCMPIQLPVLVRLGSDGEDAPTGVLWSCDLSSMVRDPIKVMVGGDLPIAHIVRPDPLHSACIIQVHGCAPRVIASGKQANAEEIATWRSQWFASPTAAVRAVRKYEGESNGWDFVFVQNARGSWHPISELRLPQGPGMENPPYLREAALRDVLTTLCDTNRAIPPHASRNPTPEEEYRALAPLRFYTAQRHLHCARRPTHAIRVKGILNHIVMFYTLTIRGKDKATGTLDVRAKPRGPSVVHDGDDKVEILPGVVDLNRTLFAYVHVDVAKQCGHGFTNLRCWVPSSQ